MPLIYVMSALCYRKIVPIVVVLLLWAPGALTTEAAQQSYSPTTTDSPSNNDFVFLISGGYRDLEVLKMAKYMVSLRSRVPRKYFGDNHFCAGTIIGPRTILTAGHCVMDRRKVLTRPRRMLVVAGTPNRLNIINTTIQYPVQSITAHPNFMRKNMDDIAIIRIRGAMPTTNQNIQIMPLPTRAPPYGQNCTTIGWGRLYYNGPLAASPTHVSLRLFTTVECQAKHPRWSENALCAGDALHYNEDPCRGDSGGPLICNSELTGVVSWTIGCGSKTYPSLYTDVFANLQWIIDNIDAAPRVRSSHFVIIALLLLFQHELQVLVAL